MTDYEKCKVKLELIARAQKQFELVVLCASRMSEYEDGLSELSDYFAEIAKEIKGLVK